MLHNFHQPLFAHVISLECNTLLAASSRALSDTTAISFLYGCSQWWWVLAHAGLHIHMNNARVLFALASRAFSAVFSRKAGMSLHAAAIRQKTRAASPASACYRASLPWRGCSMISARYRLAYFTYWRRVIFHAFDDENGLPHDISDFADIEFVYMREPFSPPYFAAGRSASLSFSLKTGFRRSFWLLWIFRCGRCRTVWLLTMIFRWYYFIFWCCFMPHIFFALSFSRYFDMMPRHHT